jgi:hypothetical protein
LALIWLFSFKFCRRLLYEIFLLSHRLLSGAVVGALWLHIKPGWTPSRICLVVSSASWVSLTLFRWAGCFARNFSWSKARTKATIGTFGGAFEVLVRVPNQWEVKAGQYVYLTIPQASFWSILQRHPFMISDWSVQDGTLNLYLVIEQRRGFTSKLGGYNEATPFIDGPYGGTKRELGEYGTVLMIATGMGIVNHLLHIKELLQGYDRWQVKTKRIALHWYLDRDGKTKSLFCAPWTLRVLGQQSWVKPIMDTLLEYDKSVTATDLLSEGLKPPSTPIMSEHGRAWACNPSLLRIFIYVDAVMPAPVMERGERIKTFNDYPDICKIIESAYHERKGKMVICGKSMGFNNHKFKRENLIPGSWSSPCLE